MDQLLQDIIKFYNEYQTEDGVHPGVGWEYCQEDHDKYGLEETEFHAAIAQFIDDGNLTGYSETEEGGQKVWHGLMPA